MQVALPELEAPAKIVFDPEERLTDDEYFAFCQANPQLRLERTAQGEIVIMPPAGGESDHRSLNVGAQLQNWAQRDGRGKAFGSSVEFILPDGSALSPDAAWVSNSAIERLTKEQRRKFLRVVPEFVVEVLSASDRPRAAQAKMLQWIANGVQLAWLIDGDARTVHISRPGREPELRTSITQLAGEGPVKGFVLELQEIWTGL
jgi:Uma2 family endonuclease